MQNLYQSLVAVEPATLVVTILNLFLQMYIVKRFFLDKIRKVLDQRREAADKEISDARNARAEALALKKAYEQNVEQAKAEAGALVERGRKTAVAQSEELLQTTQQQIVQMKQKAQEDIDREKRKALNDAKDEIAGLAMEIAEKVVGHSLDEGDQRRLVDSFIDQLGDGL